MYNNAGSRINFSTLCTKFYVAIRIRKRDYLQILQVISSNPGKVVGPVFLGRRVADPRTLRGCGDPRTLFLKRVRGGPFFEKVNTAMVRGATERRP